MLISIRICLLLIQVSNEIIYAFQNQLKICTLIGTALGEIEAAFICNKLNLLDEAEIHIKKADDILKITHGSEHLLVTSRWNVVKEDIESKRNAWLWRKLRKFRPLHQKKLWFSLIVKCPPIHKCLSNEFIYTLTQKMWKKGKFIFIHQIATLIKLAH